MRQLIAVVALTLALGGLLAACSTSTSASPASPTDSTALTDAEMAWCPGYIPAIYRAGMRIGATPPPDLAIVKRTNSEAIAAGQDSDEMRFVVFGTMLREDQLELESQWKDNDMAGYNRACKAAFASKE